MAQKRIRMVQRDILNDRLRLLYDDGTQGVLEYGEARFPFQGACHHQTERLCWADAQAGQTETWHQELRCGP